MPKVAVALSGGIDSAVTAMLLQDEGYKVSGITLNLQAEKRAGLDAASRVAKKLGIEFTILDLQRYFAEAVVEPFRREYSAGKTPNPCVSCNQLIKFGALLDFVRDSGNDFLATGHYCRIGSDSGILKLYKGSDPSKDQSYFLHTLQTQQLASIRFPLGTYSKAQVRALASARGLDRVVLSRESQDACFIPDGNYQDLVAGCAPSSEGEIVDSRGNVLGFHRGIFRYTIGQRHGTGIASSRRLYVKEIDPKNNRIVVGSRDELMCHDFFITHPSWVNGFPPSASATIFVKTRYKGTEVPLNISLDEPEAHVFLSSPLWAVAPGQSAVFYRGNEVVGGGMITRTGVTGV